MLTCYLDYFDANVTSYVPVFPVAYVIHFWDLFSYLLGQSLGQCICAEKGSRLAADKRVPTGRSSRLLKLVGTTARSGLSLLSKSPLASASNVAENLSQLRGLATKIGQMASYVDGLIPDTHQAVYEEKLKTLLSAAASSSAAEVEQLFTDELNRSPQSAFSKWESQPIASASIGQVHRAWLKDGTPVAVKVQHPGIAKALESDLSNAGLLESTLARAAGMRRFNSHEILAEIRTRFREELDYGLEARRQGVFEKLFEGDNNIHIPHVFSDLSAQRVMTSEWVEGMNFDEACSSSDIERQAWCETLWHFVYKSNLVGGVFNADPHPGNYIFHSGGRVSFLDFGCVQEFATPRRMAARAVHKGARDRDRAAFVEASRALFGFVGGPYEERALAYLETCFRPLSDSPFRVTRSYVVELVDMMKALVSDFRKPSKDGYVPLPPQTFFFNRLQFGFYSVLARLDSEVDYAAVERAFLEESAI